MYTAIIYPKTDDEYWELMHLLEERGVVWNGSSSNLPTHHTKRKGDVIYVEDDKRILHGGLRFMEAHHKKILLSFQEWKRLNCVNLNLEAVKAIRRVCGD